MTIAPRLEVAGVSYRYNDTTVIDRVDLACKGGEFIALMGANGAGKSTLLDLMANLRQPAEGRVSLDGVPLTGWNARALARRLSHLPQSVAADLSFQVEQLVLMARYPHTDQWHESAADHESVDCAMERTRCIQFRDRRVSSLSGGERQRVLLAACLAQETAVLLLDEPSTFLDIDQQLHCFDLLREEAWKGALCVAVTHDLNLALTYCTRIVVLFNSRVGADIPTSEAEEHAQEWLPLFSPRLRMGRTPEGRPWVWC